MEAARVWHLSDKELGVFVALLRADRVRIPVLVGGFGDIFNRGFGLGVVLETADFSSTKNLQVVKK